MKQNTEIKKLLVHHGMHSESYDFQSEVKKFISQMEAGLAENHASSLLMLPTYISTDGEIQRNKKVIVLDAGGTNFRVATVYFDDKGKAVIENYHSYPMPGTNGEISAQEFFDTVAGHLLPVIRLSDTIAFCFSYVADTLPNHDGKLVAFCKEVKVRDAEGVLICAETAKALKRKGVAEPKRFVLLNDAAATLLGGKAAGKDSCDSYVGFILGTGTNSCYIEQTTNIKKLGDVAFPGSNMIINIESGVYTGFLQGTIDKKIDRATANPGDHVFEKMISGAYLGTVMLKTIRQTADNGLLSAQLLEKLSTQKTLTLREADDFYRGAARNVLMEMTAENPTDREGIRFIIESLYDRAAKLVAVNFAAIIMHIGKGVNLDRPICICAEGTTFHKSELFQKYLALYIRQEINQKMGISLKIAGKNDAALVGSAVAGLLNKIL